MTYYTQKSQFLYLKNKKNLKKFEEIMSIWIRQRSLLLTLLGCIHVLMNEIPKLGLRQAGE